MYNGRQQPNNGQLTANQLYQQYLTGRRVYSANQRQRLLNRHPELASSVTTIPLSNQFPRPIITPTARNQFRIGNPAFNAVRYRVPNQYSNQNRLPVSYPGRSLPNTRRDVCNDDVPLVNTANIANGDSIRFQREEFFMTVFANYKPGMKSPNGGTIYNYYPVHPAGLMSAAVFAHTYSQWKIHGFTLKFHSYLNSNQNATVWIAIDYDFHSSTVPTGWDTCAFSNSKNFTTQESNVIINSDPTYDVNKTYRCDNQMDEHETTVEQKPCQIIANAQYSGGSGDLTNFEVGYLTIAYDIEFLHIRKWDGKHTITPRLPKDFDDSQSIDTAKTKFGCFSSLKKDK